MSLLKNEAQEQAIKTIYGPVLLISCPGSGKTTTLVRRIHHLIEEGITPSSILMVTFTKDAAMGMQEKYISLFGSNPGVTFATIHSLCFNILKREHRCTQDDVLSEDRKMGVLMDFFKSKRIYNGTWDMALATATGISAMKNNYLKPDEVNVQGVGSEMFAEAYESYEAWRIDNHLLDFDDMLLSCHTMLKNEPAVLDKYRFMFRFIQCDEYQDTNYIQRDILYLLAGHDRNLCVVGDDDQSIYAFRGARPDIMLNFPKDFPDAAVIRMGTNYRSASEIVKLADRLIKRNKDRFEKDFVSQRGSDGAEGKVIRRYFNGKKPEMAHLLNEIRRYHYEGVPYKEMAVLFRTNMQAQAPVTLLSEAGIPYYSTENVKSMYESFIFEDIHDYVMLSAGLGGSKEFFNVLNHPNRYLKEYHFRNVPYNIDAMMQACSYIAHSGERWQLDNAHDAIYDWMHAFGPGMVSLSSRPADVFGRMNGAAVSIHYDKYVAEYAKFRNLDYPELRELYDDLKKDACQFDTIGEWFTHADESIRKLREEMRNKDREGVVLTTMHRSKGLEWKVVFIIDADEDITPHKKSKGDDLAMQEERRLFYVAMTRAKDELQVYSSTEKRSMFIEEFAEEPKAPVVKNDISKVVVKDVPKFLPGKGVEHNRFGKGKVVRYEPGKIIVNFEKEGEKILKFPETFASGIAKYL